MVEKARLPGPARPRGGNGVATGRSRRKGGKPPDFLDAGAGIITCYNICNAELVLDILLAPVVNPGKSPLVEGFHMRLVIVLGVWKPLEHAPEGLLALRGFFL